MQTDLGHFEILFLHISSICKSLARACLKRIKRTEAKVNEEYNDGHWKKILDEKNWLKFSSLDDFLYSNLGTGQIKCILDNRYVRTGKMYYYQNRNLALLNLLKSNFDNLHEVLEIGSGTGFNLFSLAALLPNSNFYGVDISPNGIQAAREIAAHFKLQNRMHFEILDLTEVNHRGFKILANKNCFTFYCLEQVPYSIEKVVQHLITAGPKRILNIEPSTELLKLSRPTDWANFIYVWSQDYQTQLFTVLKKLSGQKKVKLLKQGLSSFTPTFHNRGFVAVWDPN